MEAPERAQRGCGQRHEVEIPGVDADAYGYTEEPVASAPPLRNRSFCQRRLYVSGQGSRKIHSPLSRSLARM